MRRFKWLLVVAAISLVAVSWSSGGDDDDDGRVSLTQQINGGENVVDLSGQKFSEDASVNSGVVIKNGDFGGKTLTVNSGDVVLDNVQNVTLVISESVTSGTVTIKNSNGTSVSIVVKGGSSITIWDSAITNVSVEKENATVELSGDTKVTNVDVKEEGANISGDSSSSIGNLSVDSGVKNVGIDGGKVDSVSAGDAVVTVGGGVEISDMTGGKVVVTDDTVKIPEKVTKIEITSVSLEKDSSVKTEYEIGDAFDFTGLSAKIKYNDGSESKVSLTKVNATVVGFKAGEAGSCTVTFIYKGKDVDGSLSVTVKVSSKEYKRLLEEGVELLINQQYDEGIAKIRAAYEKEQNDETKMYYALSELALISTDESVANIVRNNFGITNYPATLNALINGEWLKEYKRSRKLNIYEIQEYSYTNYVRVSGDECSYDTEGSVNFYCILDSDGDWIDSWNYADYCNGCQYITNVKLDENGKYLVYYNNLPYSIKNQVSDPKFYSYSWSGNYKTILVDRGSRAPAFALPEWLKDSDRYKDSLVKSTQTAYSLQLLIYGNLIDCNPKGANELIDSILKVFGDKFENAKNLASSISASSVTVPSKVITALCLEDVFGDSSVRIGKAELNVLISAMQILKGTFQWISSYDLSANVSSLKTLFNEVNDDDEFEKIRNFSTEKTFAVRDASAMASSKQTFLDAIDLLETSYNYLAGTSSEYPQAAKDELKKYGNILLAAEKDLKSSIMNGTVFYIPSENPFASGAWTVSAASALFGIDMGKFFEPGYFSNIIERSGYELKIVTRTEIYYHMSKNGEWYYETKYLDESEVTASMNCEGVLAAEEAKAEAFIERYKTDGYDVYWADCDTCIGVKINEDVLKGLLPGMSFGNMILPLWGFDSYDIE